MIVRAPSSEAKEKMGTTPPEARNRIMNRMHDDIVEVLISREAIDRRVAKLGETVQAAYGSSDPLLVGVLKGCVLFMADLVRRIDLPLEMDYIAVGSYGGVRQSTGAVRIIKDLDHVIEGRDVLVVEGIVDTGMTIGYILRNLQARQPNSIRLCALLNKPARRIVDVPIDYQGFEIPDRFVVGYGLDFQQRYRNLPFIGVLSDRTTGLQRG
jgi:hypoxanthine phosphoribosyltransferase